MVRKAPVFEKMQVALPRNDKGGLTELSEGDQMPRSLARSDRLKSWDCDQRFRLGLSSAMARSAYCSLLCANGVPSTRKCMGFLRPLTQRVR